MERSAKAAEERSDIKRRPFLPPSLPPYLERHQPQGMSKKRSITTRPLVRAGGRPVVIRDADLLHSGELEGLREGGEGGREGRRVRLRGRGREGGREGGKDVVT